MPGPITHFLFGQKTIDLLPGNNIKALILQHRQVFNLGTQGPDIFFYYRVWPWTKSYGMENLGNLLHEKNIQSYFDNFVKYLLNQSGPEKNLLYAYLCGYLCHYALDLFTHPYIFYRTGFLRPGETSSQKYIYRHRVFETAVDVLMLNMLLAIKPFPLKIFNLISVEQDEAEKIGKAYEYFLPVTFRENITSEQVCQAIIDMVRVQAVLQDRWGIKKKILYRIEKLLGPYPMISSMIYSPVLPDDIDYLNLQHTPWFLPWDHSVKQTLSFPQMFDQAADEARELCESLYGCMSGNIGVRKTMDRIGNRSFSTGLDCRVKVEYRYCE